MFPLQNLACKELKISQRVRNNNNQIKHDYTINLLANTHDSMIHTYTHQFVHEKTNSCNDVFSLK